jgi:hypothetical protein
MTAHFTITLPFTHDNILMGARGKSYDDQSDFSALPPPHVFILLSLLRHFFCSRAAAAARKQKIYTSPWRVITSFVYEKLKFSAMRKKRKKPAQAVDGANCARAIFTYPQHNNYRQTLLETTERKNDDVQFAQPSFVRNRKLITDRPDRYSALFPPPRIRTIAVS